LWSELRTGSESTGVTPIEELLKSVVSDILKHLYPAGPVEHRMEAGQPQGPVHGMTTED